MINGYGQELRIPHCPQSSQQLEICRLAVQIVDNLLCDTVTLPTRSDSISFLHIYQQGAEGL
jgi:hypothetical protein